MSQQKYTTVDWGEAREWGIPDSIALHDLESYTFWRVSCDLRHLDGYNRLNERHGNSENVTYSGKLIDQPSDIIFTKKEITVVNNLKVSITGSHTQTSFRINYVIARKN